MPIAWEVGRVILRLRNTGRFDLGRGNSSGALGYSESRMR